MKATRQLKNEHQGVLLMLQILEKVSLKLSKGEDVDLKHLNRIGEFLTVFVDRCHHTKEESLLFPALEKGGIPKFGGPIEVMLLEHDSGREYVRGFKKALADYEAGDKRASKKITENAQNYITLLREHISKEDNILYMIADMHLDKKKQQELVKEFEKVEVEKIGAGKHEEFHQLLNQLKKIYL